MESIAEEFISSQHVGGYPIPSCFFLKSKQNGETVYDCLDSKQRLTSIFGFINGKYALHALTPEVILDGTTYDIANLKFDELSEECLDELLGYRFSIFCLEDCTELSNLENGVKLIMPLSIVMILNISLKIDLLNELIVLTYSVYAIK